MNGDFFTLIEFQQRENKPCTVCMLSTGSQKSGEGVLYNILLQCSFRSGVWKNIDIGLNVVSMKHSWADGSSFSDSVFKRL